MKTLLAIILMLPLTCLACEPVIFTLDAENDSYTVPENCTLVVSAINNHEYGWTADLAIVVGEKSCPWAIQFGSSSPSSYQPAPHQTPLRPIKIPGGATLKLVGVEEWGVIGDGTITFFCTLERESKRRGWFR